MSGRKVCAIYTRKSTEEGLDQAFNSLHAQAEACSAFIASQRHEGWVPAKGAYDDGGYSGGSMARPGLQRLLADVAAGRVDVIVVYKVDRLTRSLADFAKIVDILDKRSASFVSVTQAFNTTTSMGRLTLNVLLSFAQFEREVTGERIRDKIAASKAKGLWMGGTPPLGYRVEDRKLVVVPEQAATVRHIFGRYASLKCGSALLADLAADGIHTRARSDGKGGKPFQRGPLFVMLGNRTYRGEVVHKGNVYPGEHDAIVGEDLWNRVQVTLADNRVQRIARPTAADASLLTGKLTDGHGRRMVPSHTVRKGVRYRYYVTHPDAQGDRPAWRLRAAPIDKAVVAQLRALVADTRGLLEMVDGATLAPDDAAQLPERHKQLSDALSDPRAQRLLVRQLVIAVTLGDERISIVINRTALPERLGLQVAQTIDASAMSESITLTAALEQKRYGQGTRMVLSTDAPARDERAVALLREAHALQNALIAEPALSLRAYADREGQCRKRLARVLKLAWLAPDIVAHVVKGEQPVIAAARLLECELPLCWQAQTAAVGLTAQ